MKNDISLVEYLKMYTAIPIRFINKYYEFYKKCYRNKHGIPIEDVIKYLGISKEKKFMERLRENYKEQLDFIIVRSVNKNYCKI